MTERRMRLTTGAEFSQRLASNSMGNLVPQVRDAWPTRTKLRLHRNYSIKLMLAWETCCRSKFQTPDRKSVV